ncbi:MAG: phosphatase PAP2 family protein [Acidimicrobiia bacterium]
MATATAAATPILPRSKRWRFGWIGEVAVMIVLYRAYDFMREQAVGTTAKAFANARDIIAAEKLLGIYWERPIQQAFLNVDWFIAFWNIYYGTIHFVLPLVTLVWLYRKVPARYVRWRNTLVLMWAIAVLTFFVYPLMPPRLMPARFDYVDTAAEYFNFGPQLRVSFDATGQPTEKALEQFGNPYAAMPSFHVGWSTWCLLALWPLVRRRWVRALLVLYVTGVIFCITVTGNHWLLDAVGGWIVLGLGYAGATGIDRSGAWWRARRAGVTDPGSASVGVA